MKRDLTSRAVGGKWQAMNADEPSERAPGLSSLSSAVSRSSSSLQTSADVSILHRYLSGESVSTLASEHGLSTVSRRALYDWLYGAIPAGDHEPLVTRALIGRIADSDEEMDRAVSKLDIVRAREKMRFSRMDFERRRPNLYGQQTYSSEEKKLTIVVKRDIEPRIIESTPLPSLDPTPSEEKQ